MMRPLVVTLLLTLWAPPALAEWPTLDFVPVPDTGPIAELMDNDLAPYATDAEIPDHAETATVGTLDIGLMKGVAEPLFDHVLAHVSQQLDFMVQTGFDAPVIQPLITETSTGKRYYPMFWQPFSSAPARHGGCAGPPRVTLQISDVAYPYPVLRNRWNLGGDRRLYRTDQLFRLIVHETMHGIQQNTWLDRPCDDSPAPKWLSESLADGVSYYLLGKVTPNVTDKWEFPRNARRYDRPLNVGGAGSGRNDFDYGTGSFFRYLMEATEVPGYHGLQIAKDIVDIPPAKMGNKATLIDAIDDVVTRHAGSDRKGGKRTLYNVLPEFYTEYGSYGGSRYSKYFTSPATDPSASVPMTPSMWLEAKFYNCVEFDITPMHQVRKQVRIWPLAGECIHVKWSGFTVPVGLQMFADDLKDRHGDLTMGQAVWTQGSDQKYCWDVTKELQISLSWTSDHKCILKRGTPRITSPATGRSNVALWTSDTDINGSGEAYFILTNVSEKVSESKGITFDLLVGALGLEMDTNPIQPRSPGANPVENGLSNLSARLHTFNGNEDRMLFDARVIDGPGPGFSLASGAMPATQQGVLSIVRGSNYWVGFLGNAPSSDGAGDGAIIVKYPRGMEEGLATPGGLSPAAMEAAMFGSIVAGGPVGHIPGGMECGYDFSPIVRIEEQSRDAFVFHIEADMFDFSNMASLSGIGSACDMMAQLHEERASFTVSFPYGALYSGEASVSIESPPGQESHLANFQPGPSFGGIASSQSLLEQGDAPSGGAAGSGSGGAGGGEEGTGSDSSSGGAGGGDGGTTSAIETCSCRCPTVAVPDTPSCRLQCSPKWESCVAPTQATSAEPLDLFRQALSGRDLPPSVTDMLVEDFRQMSPATQQRILEVGRSGN